VDLKKFYSICIQGNVLKALDYLQSSEDKDEETLEIERKYIKRFVDKGEEFEINSDDPLVKEIILEYYKYFISVLTGNDSALAEKELAEGLSKIIDADGEYGIDRIEGKLKAIFEEKGYSFLGGVTIPYRGPYIWKATKKQEFDVELPCDRQKVAVFFMSGFIMLSWLHFATFGRHHTGGWAKSEGIYYVVPGDEDIDTDSDKFRVWFLKHEGQHLSDYAKYPNLKAVGLEYRAKLTEIIYYQETHLRLESFINESKNDNSLSHPYSSYLIVKRLSKIFFDEEFTDDMEKWHAIDKELIQKEAYHLFMLSEEILAGTHTKKVL